jgi:hypothetical protein
MVRDSIYSGRVLEVSSKISGAVGTKNVGQD